jgi:hypothetical protein
MTCYRTVGGDRAEGKSARRRLVQVNLFFICRSYKSRGYSAGRIEERPHAMAGDLKLGPATEGGPDDVVGQMLPQVLDLTQATPLRDGLLGKRPVVLDAGSVERMSTPCAQVLLAAGRQGGDSFRIINASAVFRAALVDLGLQTEFSKWMD